MSSDEILERQRHQAFEFVANIFGMTEDEAKLADTSVPPGFEFSAATPRKNQPEFWADAPWRIEPDCDELPLSFIIRDANIRHPAKGPWRLDVLNVDQKRADGLWHDVCSLGPEKLPQVSEQGDIDLGFWTHRIGIPLFEEGTDCALYAPEVRRGGKLHLRVSFRGSFPPHEEIESSEIHLEVQLAGEALPQGRAATGSGSRHWFYGDTHYHSAYTNDVKEFGGPVPDTRDAGQAIGLDWLVVTDHSCDLDEDDDLQGRTRWERLKAELARPEVSDDRFRVILGEEITLRGGDGERYVHMLAMGGMEAMVEGGFLPDEGGGFVTELFQGALEEIFKMAIKDGGYDKKTASRLFGPVHRLETVLGELLPPETLVFAAHPYTLAQPPFVNCDWALEDLENPRLTGHEFWNGRHRRSAMFTKDPFAKAGFASPKKLKKADRERIKKLQDHVEQDWEMSLRRGIDAWAPGADRPALRPVFIAGSDAHGSFNHSVGWGWDYQSQLMVNDNALGRVRTAVHLPGHGSEAVPETGDILAALEKGACAVTDGPLLEFSLTHDGQTATLGDALPVSGGGDLVLKIEAHTTAEFGDVEKVEVVTYFRDPGSGAPAAARRRGGILGGIGALVDGWLGRGPRKTAVRAGQTKTLSLAGSQGYCRLQARTVGQSGERFCCFTNPIWVRIVDGQEVRLRVEF